MLKKQAGKPAPAPNRAANGVKLNLMYQSSALQDAQGSPADPAGPRSATEAALQCCRRGLPSADKPQPCMFLRRALPARCAPAGPGCPAELPRANWGRRCHGSTPTAPQWGGREGSQRAGTSTCRDGAAWGSRAMRMHPGCSCWGEGSKWSRREGVCSRM